MNLRSRFFKRLCIVLAVIIFSGTALVTAQKVDQFDQAQNEPPLLPTNNREPLPTRPFYCVPLPITIISTESPTPTLDPLTTPIPNPSPNPEPAPSVTPRVYSNIVDLNPEIPIADKWVRIIFRCNGTFDKYLYGSETDVNQYLNLGPGDVILNTIAPASLMGHQVPEPPDWPTTTSAITSPYPPPATSVTITLTVIPYPISSTSTPEDNQP